MPQARTPSPSPQMAVRAPAPFIAPLSGDINQRFASVAQAINGKADLNGTPTFGFVKLMAPGGAIYAVSVDDGGNLHTTQVLR